MKYTRIIVPISALAFMLSAMPVAAAGLNLGVGARVGGNASTSGNGIMRGQTRGEAAIDARIQALTDLSGKLDLKIINDQAAIDALHATLNAEIANLTALRAKIASDTSSSSLKEDDQSITKSFRVYLLVEPQMRITVAADHILAIATKMEALATKLQARITAAASAGVDVTADNAALTDFNAKVADAQTQANAAITEVANLQPDNGDKTVQASNTAALKDARSKLVTARQDLTAAYHDAATIAASVHGKGEANASTTTSTP